LRRLTTEGLPVFHTVHAPTATELQALLNRIITRIMNRMHRDVQLEEAEDEVLDAQGLLIEEQGMTYLADTDLDLTLGPLRAAACTYRIALGPRAGQKVLSLQTVPTAPPTPGLCARAGL